LANQIDWPAEHPLSAKNDIGNILDYWPELGQCGHSQAAGLESAFFSPRASGSQNPARPDSPLCCQVFCLWQVDLFNLMV
jgi:hypothetical protein